MTAPLVTLLLPELLPLGGVERVTLQLSQRFVELGYRVDLVLAHEENDWSDVVPEGVRVIVLGAPRTRNVPLPLANYLRCERPDALLVSLWPMTAVALATHHLVGCKSRVIVSDHNMLSIQYGVWGALVRASLRASLTAIYRFADARACVSAGVADDVARLSGLPRERFDVIYNPLPISVDDHRGDAEAEAAWGGWKGPRILTVGRFKAQKNHALLLRAFKRLLANRDAKLMMLGTGELFDTTRELIRAEGLGERVVAPGQSNHPSAYYRAADLFVLSSDYEGFGNVLIEALAHGLPVVSTKCQSGPSEILEDGRYGRLVPVGDEAALAEAMAQALDAPHDPHVAKRRAGEFGVERIADQYLGLLFPNSQHEDLPTSAADR